MKSHEVYQYSLTSVLHTSLGENAQVCYSEVCVISEKDQMMKTKHGGTKYVRYSEGYTIVHVCDTEVKLYFNAKYFRSRCKPQTSAALAGSLRSKGYNR